MREQILKYVAENPNCRARNVASHLHKWVCEVSVEMHAMAREGLLKSTYHHNPAQMEFYDTYELPGSPAIFFNFLKKSVDKVRPLCYT